MLFLFLLFQNILRLVKRFYVFYFIKNLEFFWLILKVFSEKYAIINLSDVHGLCVKEKKQTERQVIESKDSFRLERQVLANFFI